MRRNPGAATVAIAAAVGIAEGAAAAELRRLEAAGYLHAAGEGEYYPLRRQFGRRVAVTSG